MVKYISAYAPLFLDYINFKRSLGYQYKNEYMFASFDRLLAENNIKEIGLTRDICELWAVRGLNESEKSRYKRINDIRNFSIYLNKVGYPSYISRQNNHYKTTFIPYIFTNEELGRFFSCCDTLSINDRRSKTAPIYPAAFRLIYGCGLRANEALSIKCKDICLQKKYVIIREPKNGEDRMLPLSDSLVEILRLYNERHRSYANMEDYFFVKKDNNRCSSDTMYRWFRKTLHKAGISHGGRGYGPCIHSFRHSFSVHSLAAMSDAGLDLYYCLPLLSKYLGHKSLEATDKYVRLTADMYPGIMDDMNQLSAYVFPEVDRL